LRRVKYFYLEDESLCSLLRDFSIKFKNIFPSKCYSDDQTYCIYYNSSDESTILHLESIWVHNVNMKEIEKNNTDELLNLICNQGYKLLLRLRKKERNSSL